MSGQRPSPGDMCACGHSRSEHAVEFIGWLDCLADGCDCDGFRGAVRVDD